ncbi:MAG TPA: lipid-A-disaccharide synthase [Bacteroidales bacterium]|jgi:lipid-A-disaccharide synthase|nr:lipid-A-disaccharide synthase [Bacteroidales bacterium]MDI9573637.1 lipid-A-disaccharide synthase [Bacteroidota bacterium]OQC62005.1 MAG: Lipid-A-disaccharide synthase [Bacteroidetes bacterium ADurb.Bin012]MBP9511033.1 lipid-A-disaccharide synthase [Bacteroidales bacterium]MBP9587734.1 lipid-A-disaccharide synthase [Bacteroidales bacterium]
MKYYLIVGEASGDLHASNLVKAIQELDSEAEFRGFGGDLMKKAGVNIIKHHRDLSFMGFVEVAGHLPTIIKILNECKSDILNFQPHALILVDYPGFNLRIAKFARKNNIKVIYYVSPQVWAWHQSRVRSIKKYVNRMITILPFESDFYSQHHFEVFYAGHPLLDVISEYIPPSREEFLSRNSLNHQPIIAILPGSRKQEIKVMLPVMLSMVKRFPEFQFVIGAAPSLPDNFFEPITNHHRIAITKGQTYDLLSHSYAALVTSGTASLETALLNVPQVICYKGQPLSYFIARRMVKIGFIGLPNLIAGRQVVKELIQNYFTPARLYDEIDKIVKDERYRNEIRKGYDEIRHLLGGPGASKRAANEIVRVIASQS